MASGWGDNTLVHSWEYWVGPARPSPSGIKFIKKKILEKGKNAKVLVLGSTPEFRSLCGELGIVVTLFDFSRHNYEFLKREVKNSPKEIFVEGNWLTKPIDQKFDIILGDHLLNIISNEDINTLFSNVSKMMKKDGLFMSRCYVRDKDERYTGEQAIKEYREERKGQSFFIGTLRNLMMATFDYEKGKGILSELWKILAGLHKKGLVTEEELEEYRKASINRDFEFFIPLKEKLENDLSKFFNIKEIFHGTEEYLKDQLPLYVLTRK